MAGTRTSWTAGAALAGVAVLTGSWFLLIGPLRTEIAATSETTELQTTQNGARELALVRLTEQYARLDEYRADLARLQAAIPAQAELPDLTREFQEAAERTDVTIVQMTSATPVVVSDPTAVAGSGTSADGGTAGSVEGTGQAGDTGAVPGVTSMQLGLTVLGDYDAVTRFASEVQTGTERLVLVSAVTATSQTEAGASGGRPATAAGDVQISFTAHAFTLADPNAVGATTGDDEVRGSLPASSRDPFTPLD